MRYALLAFLGLLVLGGVGCGGSTPAGPNEIRVVVKLSPHPWFNRLNEGVMAAATELPANAMMVGPTPPPEGTDPAVAQMMLVQGQMQLIQQAINDHVDVLGVVPDDANAIEPLLMQARAAGIVVLTHESPNQVNADWDIETIDNQAFAETAMQELAREIGETGQVGQFVGGADLHRYWNQVARTYAENHYPNIHFVSIETATADDPTPPTACAEDAAACATATATLLTMFPSLAGMLTFGSQGAIGAGQQLMTANNTNVAVVGVAVPSQAAALMAGGWIDRGYLWDPRDAGYALVAVGNLIANGTQPGAGLSVGTLGTAVVNQDTKDIYFNRVLEITPDNVDTFTF